MGHQVEVERQFGAVHGFEQREHVAAKGGGDEEVAVLHARGNATQLDRAADGVVAQPLLQRFVGDGGEDGHAVIGDWG